MKIPGQRVSLLLVSGSGFSHKVLASWCPITFFLRLTVAEVTTGTVMDGHRSVPPGEFSGKEGLDPAQPVATLRTWASHFRVSAASSPHLKAGQNDL